MSAFATECATVPRAILSADNRRIIISACKPSVAANKYAALQPRKWRESFMLSMRQPSSSTAFSSTFMPYFLYTHFGVSVRSISPPISRIISSVSASAGFPRKPR
ncbi:MAG TPA: hypothetical protein DCX90_03795 [Ruminococcaceae bacterium]|nr:hypothetical protein [Oscillospiraceae bacterium]